MRKTAIPRSGGNSAGKRLAKRLPKLERKKFESALEKLHVELVKLQLWVKHKGLKMESSSRGATPPARAVSSSASPNASALECFA